MESLFNLIQDFCEQHKNRKKWLAFSGGMDSHVLLHVFSQFSLCDLHVVHVNHQLSPNAKKWAAHCEAVCRAFNFSFHLVSIHAQAGAGESPEEVARDARYKAFADKIEKEDVLITAHHQEDQAETLLLQLLRGAGLKGLSAMPVFKAFSQGWHARPFLNVSRKELQQYAERHQLKWIDDESNENIKFSRNFIRHEVMPVLKKRWPTVAETFSRSAEHCAQAQSVLDVLAKKDREKCAGSLPHTLSIKKLKELDDASQSHVLREWLTQLGFALPSFVKLQHIQKDMLHAREDKSPCVHWKGVELRRYRDDLFALAENNFHDPAQIIPWDFQTVLSFSFGKLKAVLTKGKGLRRDLKNITVRFRQGGECCQLPGRTHRHELKKLFQTWNVPPWERDRVPLIFVENQLAAVVGYCISDTFAVGEGEEGYLISQV